MSFKIWYYGDSDIGLLRNENQDSFGKYPVDTTISYDTKGILFIIADGMGGHACGKEASQTAVDIVIKEYFSSKEMNASSALYSAFKTANKHIFQSSLEESHFRRKGTTCTALVLQNDFATIAHVGDTRIYRVRSGKIEQLTLDHTQVEEFFRKGILTKDEAANHPAKSVLVRALGIEDNVEVDIIKDIPVINKDIFILCTDGLIKVSKNDIRNVVLNNSPAESCKKLIALANESGGTDNTTVQVIKVIDTLVNEVVESSVKEKEQYSSFFVISRVLLIVLIISAIGLIYKKEIINIFSGNNENLTDLKYFNTKTFNTDELVQSAKILYESGNLDSALILYNLILEKNPMHAGSINEKEIITKKIIEYGDNFFIKGDYLNAVRSYKKAFAQNTENIALSNKILLAENKIQAASSKSKINIISKTQVNTKENSKNNNPDKIEHTVSDLPLTFNTSEWLFSELTETDYKLDAQGITFYDGENIKKLISRNSMTDFNIEISIQFENAQFESRTGIIIGYQSHYLMKNEFFISYTVDNFGNFSLSKFLNGKEEVIKSVHQNTKSYKDKNYKLKLKCLGPWVLLYNDNKLLESWLSEEFIDGKIGLFSQGKSNVYITSIKTSSAFENK